MDYVWGIFGLSGVCAVWMIIQLWTGKGNKQNKRWRGGGRCAAISAMIVGCADDSEPFVQSVDQIMGTVVVVTAPLNSNAPELVFDIFHDVDATMSEWEPNSPLTMVNNAAGKHPVKVPEDLFKTVKRSLEIADLTSGAFDPTWAALWGLWDFRRKNNKQIPTKAQLQSHLPLVNWEKVQLDREQQTIFLPEGGMLIGLGGIAKGLAIDRSRNALARRGIENYMIIAGGQVLVRGTKEGRPWRIGIRDPDGTQGDYFAVLNVTNTCVSTSGDYENFFMREGKRYHHIIDPRNGLPAIGTRSVTVITPDATLADALSTALFVMGPTRAIKLVNNIPGVEAVIIDSDGQVLFSNNIANRLDRLPD
jgi:thiamine biosynthesis lipoprotein